MLPYQTLIKIDRSHSIPVYVQLVNQMIQLIQAGNLQAGSKIPGSRKLAAILSINRNTVVRAMEELEALGWIEFIPNRGTFVSKKLPIIKLQKWKEDRQKGVEPSILKTIFYDFPYLSKPVVYSHLLAFDDGTPDTRLAPVNELATAYSRCLRQLSDEKKLSYGDAAGNPYLREVLAAELNNSRGLNITAANVLITRGSQMAINLAAHAVLRPKDYIVVGETNYKTANLTFQYVGGQILTVPVDEKGIVVSAIETLCLQQAIKAVYVTPHHHHPTTVTLPPERRIQLLALAEKHQFAILEDDYDYDFHYANSPILPLASADRHGLVLYMGSFSKTIAPAFRVGYLVAPSFLIEELKKLRRLLDRQGDIVLEQAIAELMEKGVVRRHYKKAVRHYKARRDFTCQLFEEKLKDLISFKKPEGGMAIWANYNEEIDLINLSQRALKKGLYLSNGLFYNTKNKQLNSARIGFANMNIEEIEKSVEIIKNLI